MEAPGTLFPKSLRAAFTGTSELGGKALQIFMNTVHSEMLENSHPPPDWVRSGTLSPFPSSVDDK